MAGKIRSEAAFSALLKSFALDDEPMAKKFKDAGWSSIGAFAVSCGFNPEKTDDSKVNGVILKTLVDWDGSDPGTPAPQFTNNIRHLFWECSNAFVADTRYRHDYGLGEIAIPTNPAERLARRKAFKAEREEQCPEIMEGDLEPAYCCEDDLQALFDKDRLDQYLHPADCPKRSQEILATTARPQARRPKAPGAPAWLTALQQGSETEASVEIPRADVADYYELDCAFRRRGICFHLVGLIRMAKTEKWRRKLLKAVRQTPADPKTQVAPSLTDILVCDKHIWLTISEECADAIQPTATKWPLEEALDKVLASATLEIMLMVRTKGTCVTGAATREGEQTKAEPRVAQPTATKNKTERNKEKREKRKLKKASAKNQGMQKELQTLRKTKGGTFQKGGKGGAKGGREQNQYWQGTGSQWTKRKFVPMPKELIGCEPRNEDDEPFCFGFAKGTCNEVQPGQKCNKGWHKCMKKGCWKNHSFVRHHKN